MSARPATGPFVFGLAIFVAGLIVAAKGFVFPALIVLVVGAYLMFSAFLQQEPD